MEPTTLKLKEPIQVGSETITELKFRRPKAKDFRTFPAEPRMGDILDLAGRICGQPKVVIDELDVADLMEVAAVVEGFMKAGRATGTEP